MKKILSFALVLMTVLALMIPAFASADEFGGVDMWVNCENGKRLNVRENPSTDSSIIVRLDCGTKVHVDYSCGNGWVAISDYHFSGYVQAKFLVSQKPGKYEITERDDDFVTVKNPYLVTAKARGTKDNSSVGLREKPTTTSKAIRRLTAGDQLQVIARGKVWSKVVDLQTRKTGYVANDYIEKN
ncbi:MAG: SH3 domain-containing protein [Clostridia bacterium]|nr:SH3 domain-containing protein [Clostridia bacterium]